jgi:hypothetical protein
MYSNSPTNDAYYSRASRQLHRAYPEGGLWSLEGVLSPRRLPVQGLSEGSLGFLDDDHAV